MANKRFSGPSLGTHAKRTFSECEDRYLRWGTCTLVRQGGLFGSLECATRQRRYTRAIEGLIVRLAARKHQIRTYYYALFHAWGPQHWWPAQSRFEVIVGAYLTQNTAWTNVEKALTNLRAAHLLSVSGIRRASLADLERLIRPAGYFRQKAKRLKIFVAFLDQQVQGLVDEIIFTTHGEASRRTPQSAWCRPRNCRFHLALRRQPSSLRGGRLHASDSRSPQDSSRRSGLRRNQGTV